MSTNDGDPAFTAVAVDALNAFLARHQVGGQEQISILSTATGEIFTEFSSAGVAALLLKGPGLARLLYEPGEFRSYVDVDILVRPKDWQSAGAVLASLGYRNMTEPLGVDDVAGVVHEETWLGSARAVRSAVQVELHRWLPGALKEPATAWETLWRSRMPIQVGGATVAIPAHDGQALQLATHAAQHGPQYLKGIRELTLALERWPTDVWRDASRLAAEVDATRAFGTGLRLVTRGALLAEALEIPHDHALEWEVRHLNERPRGAFHLDAYRKASLVGRLTIMRRALLPNSRWVAKEYPWARRKPTMLLAYGLHILRAPIWAARAWGFRQRRRRRAS